MKKKSRNNLIILVLLISIGFMGIGYAVLSSKLDIVSTISSDGIWDVGIKSINVTNIGGNANPGEVEIDPDSLSATLNVDLYNIGDYVEYTVIVKNNGNIKAKLSDVSIENTANYNDAISVTSTADIGNSIDSSKEYTFKVRIQVNNVQNITDTVGSTYVLTLKYDQDND